MRKYANFFECFIMIVLLDVTHKSNNSKYFFTNLLGTFINF